MTTNLLGVQFVEEEAGQGIIAIISSNWLTPGKREVFWPPYKNQYQYEQSLKKSETPSNGWTLHKIKKILFTRKDNDYHKAKKQLRYCEEHSDVTSDSDVLKKLNKNQTSRIRKSPHRYDNSSDENTNSEDNGKEKNRSKSVKKSHGNHFLPRPPSVLSNDESEEEDTLVTPITNIPQIAEGSASASNNTRNISSATNSIIPNVTEQSANVSGKLSKNRIVTTCMF